MRIDLEKLQELEQKISKDWEFYENVGYFVGNICAHSPAPEFEEAEQAQAVAEFRNAMPDILEALAEAKEIIKEDLYSTAVTGQLAERHDNWLSKWFKEEK